MIQPVWQKELPKKKPKRVSKPKVDKGIKDSPTLLKVDENMERDQSIYQNFTVSFGQIGEPCERLLWHKFRWSFLPPVFKAKTKRIFRSGHSIEEQVLSDLKKAGLRVFDIDPNTGEQYTYKLLGGHFKGKPDAVVCDMPEVEGIAVAGDIKSAKNTEFNKFVREGVQVWNSKYYTQIQCAAAVTETQKCFVIVECKNDGDRAIEIVDFDELHWHSTLKKAERIIKSEIQPPAIYTIEDPEVEYFMTEPDRKIYLGQALPKPNCRNCLYSEAIIDESIDAVWLCKKHHKNLDIQTQMTGCDKHLFMPQMMPENVNLVSVNVDSLTYNCANNVGEFINGASTNSKGVFSSFDLAAISQHDDLTSETLYPSEMLKLDMIIAKAKGKPVLNVKCSECENGIPDPIGKGGLMDCKLKNENKQTTLLWPYKLRDCSVFSLPTSIRGANIEVINDSN